MKAGFLLQSILDQGDLQAVDENSETDTKALGGPKTFFKLDLW